MYEISNRLRFLESSENIKNSLKKLSGRKPNTRVAESIRIFLQQGRMFVESAYAAPNEIRPLLFYYGLSAYAKVIICSKLNIGYESLPTSHGLKDCSSNALLLENMITRIEGRGLFQFFNDVINETEGLNYFSSNGASLKHNTPADLSSEMNGHTITLKDVMSRVGSIAEIYELTFNEKSNTQSFEFRSLSHEPTLEFNLREIYSDKASLKVLVDSLRYRFPALSEWRLSSASHAWDSSRLVFFNDPFDLAHEFNESFSNYNEANNSFSVNITATEEQLLGKKNFKEILGVIGGGQRMESSHFVTTYNGNYIAELSLRFIGMFMLSSLVRYRPHTWIHSLSHATTQDRGLDDRMLALIEEFTDSTVSSFLDTVEVICGVARY